MRRALRIVLWPTVVAGVAVGSMRVPGLLAEFEYFRLAQFELEGARTLTLGHVLDQMDVPAGASFWDDPTRWSQRLRAHPMVRSVRTRRRFPRTLVISLEERVPVAFVATPVLEVVDRDGVLLPVDPAERRLDLPLLQGVDPNTAELRLLAGEAARFTAADPQFIAMLSDMALDERGDIVASLGEDPVIFRFSPRMPPRRLREGMAVLAHAREQREDAVADVIDLRYQGQVVVRYTDRVDEENGQEGA